MKKKRYYKQLTDVQEVTGWAKMYYSFTDLDRFDSQYMLNYLIDTEPTIRNHCLDKGFEDYLQYTDSFIQEKLGSVSNDKINAIFKDLEKHNYIFIHHNNNNIKSRRYIKLNYNKIDEALGIDTSIERNQEEGVRYY